MVYRIAVIGGGIGGVHTAIKLASDSDTQIDIYEQRGKLLDNSPYCHLHAGGFLYPVLSIHECQELLNSCLEFAEEFGDCLTYRPTIVAYRSTSRFSTERLIFKTRLLSFAYEYYTNRQNSKPLGDPVFYYAIYTRDDMVYFKENGHFQLTTDLAREHHDPYVSIFAEMLDDIDSIKYPFISVIEPGIWQWAVEGKLLKQLSDKSNIKVYLNTYADLHIENNPTSSSNYIWKVNNREYDFVVNATGAYHAELESKLSDMSLPSYDESSASTNSEITNSIMQITFGMNNIVHAMRRTIRQNEQQLQLDNSDAMYEPNRFYRPLHLNTNQNREKQELLEVKASWYIYCNLSDVYTQFSSWMPEIAIIGERGTKNGMIQITPTENKNIYQVHCMTIDSSIIDCTKINPVSNRKPISQLFSKHTQMWIENDQIPNREIEYRGEVAIKQITGLFPKFGSASVIDTKCCWGIQRVHSLDVEKRSSQVLYRNKYVELQLSKACNVCTMANDIFKYIRRSRGTI